MVEVKIKERLRSCEDEQEEVSNYLMKKGQWELNEGTLGCTQWRINFGRDYGPNVRQTSE
jgi:hypothetical protein